MVNGITQQYPQIQQYPQNQPVQSYPLNSVGAVNIQIYNPTTHNGAAPAYPAYPQASLYGPMPQYMPYPYPVPYPVYQQQGPAQNQTQYQSQTQAAPAPQPAPTPAAPVEPKKDEKTEKKVVLTDDYIKSLENYLNNENPKIRMTGIKEVMQRFKEDKSRKNDAALTALLNKGLQDPSSTVRFMALTVLDVGYATGNDETVNILKQIQQQTGNQQQGEDALLASQILLKLSGQVVDVPAGTGHVQPKEEKPKAEK